jgi:hypothetical protein
MERDREGRRRNMGLTLEMLGDILVNVVAEVLHRASRSTKNDRGRVVGKLSLRLRVDSDEVEFLPHKL